MSIMRAMKVGYGLEEAQYNFTWQGQEGQRALRSSLKGAAGARKIIDIWIAGQY